MSRRAPVSVALERAADHVTVRWSAGGAAGSCRFDHLPGTRPAWLGSAEDLLSGADRRLADRVLQAVADAAAAEQLELGIWVEDGSVELLT